MPTGSCFEKVPCGGCTGFHLGSAENLQLGCSGRSRGLLGECFLSRQPISTECEGYLSKFRKLLQVGEGLAFAVGVRLVAKLEHTRGGDEKGNRIPNKFRQLRLTCTKM